MNEGGGEKLGLDGYLELGRRREGGEGGGGTSHGFARLNGAGVWGPGWPMQRKGGRVEG